MRQVQLDWRAVTPASTRAQYVNADRAPVIDALRAAPACRHERPDPLPFRVAQPKQLLALQDLLGSEALNHYSRRAGLLVACRPLEARAPSGSLRASFAPPRSRACARPGREARDSVHGRAVLGSRRADEPAHATRAAAHPWRRAPHGAADHARHRGSHLHAGSHHGDVAAPDDHPKNVPRELAASAQALEPGSANLARSHPE